jgi:hypothetical protein
MLTMRHIVRLLFLVTVITPAASWFLVKPMRVIAPALSAVVCPTAQIWIDDEARTGQASELYVEATAFVSNRVLPLQHPPRVIFCATQSCANAFGLGSRSAVTIGTVGTVIGPSAWKSHYVRHELIHQLQAQKLGVVQLLLKPAWFVEGMAYDLSQDPRPVLAQPWQDYRAIFREWYGNVLKAGIWESAERL